MQAAARPAAEAAEAPRVALGVAGDERPHVVQHVANRPFDDRGGLGHLPRDSSQRRRAGQLAAERPAQLPQAARRRFLEAERLQIDFDSGSNRPVERRRCLVPGVVGLSLSRRPGARFGSPRTA